VHFQEEEEEEEEEEDHVNLVLDSKRKMIIKN
jgi:hypothetical protein